MSHVPNASKYRQENPPIAIKAGQKAPRPPDSAPSQESTENLPEVWKIVIGIVALPFLLLAGVGWVYLIIMNWFANHAPFFAWTFGILTVLVFIGALGGNKPLAAAMAIALVGGLIVDHRQRG